MVALCVRRQCLALSGGCAQCVAAAALGAHRQLRSAGRQGSGYHGRCVQPNEGSVSVLEPNLPAWPRIHLVGVGLGNPDTLTRAAERALASSQLIIGSGRLLEALDGFSARKLALVRAEEIELALRTAAEREVSVVMSGDLGLHSGATRLLELLRDVDVDCIPGTSTLSYLCAKLRMPWQDACVVSAHGRAADVCGMAQTHAKTFVLTGGASGPASICAELTERGLGHLRVHVGERLSYPDERIVSGSASELAGGTYDPLSALIVLNRHPLCPEIAAPHLADDCFARGSVRKDDGSSRTIPMTKEELRELAVCKLHVRANDVVWDVGAGTGSVTVELARAACAGQVFAIERVPEASRLVKQNCAAFDLPNVRIVTGEAPEALRNLPAPDRVFVGGSGGALDAVLDAVLAANPRARICIAAITIETLSLALEGIRRLGLTEPEIVQLSVAKARAAGSSHLMMAANPVWLITADGTAS